MPGRATRVLLEDYFQRHRLRLTQKGGVSGQQREVDIDECFLPSTLQYLKSAIHAESSGI